VSRRLKTPLTGFTQGHRFGLNPNDVDWTGESKAKAFVGAVAMKVTTQTNGAPISVYTYDRIGANGTVGAVNLNGDEQSGVLNNCEFEPNPSFPGAYDTYLRSTQLASTGELTSGGVWVYLAGSMDFFSTQQGCGWAEEAWEIPHITDENGSFPAGAGPPISVD